MEILRFKHWIVLIILMIAVTRPVLAQDNLTQAFGDSYALEKKGDYAGAIAKIKAVYSESSYEMNLRLGWLSYQSGQFYESIGFYNKAITLMPYGIEARFGLAYPVYALGKIDEIVTIYEKILEIDPQNTLAHYRLGYIEYNRSKFEVAESHFEKVVNLFPFDYDSVIMLAWSKFKLQKYKEAKVLFNKALLYNPDSESAKEGLGLIK